MTDAQKVLALARTTHADRKPCVGDTYALEDGDVCVREFDVIRIRDNTVPGGWVKFDPANNADQSWEVLAWLLRDERINIQGESIFTLDADGFVCIVYAQHDGTAAGLRQAVTDAAVRVAGVKG